MLNQVVDLFFERDSVLEPHIQHFDLKEAEEFSLQEILVPIIETLNSEIVTARSNLDASSSMKGDVEHILDMLKGADLMQLHLEFIVAVFETTSEQEVQLLKEEFASVSQKYEKVKSKKDLRAEPAKYVAIAMYNAIIKEIRRIVKKSFRQRSGGKIEFVSSEENYSWIHILIDRLDFFDEHYPITVTLPEDDVLCFSKSCDIWQDLQESAINRSILNEDEVRASFQPLTSKVNLLRILFKNHVEYKDFSFFKLIYSHLRDLIYYGIQPAKAEARALFYLVKPKVEEAFQPWKVAEHPLICKYMGMNSPWIGHDELIYVPRLFPQITKEVILKEYSNNTLNKMCPMDPLSLTGPDLENKREEVIEELFVNDRNKIPIRVLAPDSLNLRGNKPSLLRRMWQKAVGIPKRSDQQPSQSQDSTIVINFHGGGFVALSSCTQKVYLTRWVKNLNLVHFSVDYRLAPDHKYPEPLDDIWQAYLWIINYAKTVLGIDNENVILTGDSAGGTLAISLALRLIRAGIKPPKGLLLVYPALSMDDNASSPSQFLSLNDSMLPVSIIKLISDAYIEKDFDSKTDPFLSPVQASDELLEKMPPIRIVASSLDPLNDDNWRLVAKLRKLKKDVKLVIHEHLPHGYLSHPDLKNYDAFVKETSDIIQELIDL